LPSAHHIHHDLPSSRALDDDYFPRRRIILAAALVPSGHFFSHVIHNIISSSSHRISEQ
jgi:hypothetical protein